MSGRANLRVLVVEDEYLLAMAVQLVLEKLGFENVHCARDLQSGRDYLVSERPALAILDINIGKDLVFPLAEELKALNVPIVFSSGRARHQMPVEWASHPFLPKPLVVHDLDETLVGLGFL
jgi:DNA-binding response OmpR family regulator